jgi:signal transduction histidine kinase/CheY-like chemotaxis protein
MSTTQPAPDPQGIGLREQLSEISQTLDALRERIRQLGGAEPAGGAPPSARADVIAPVERKELAGVEEILGIPVSGAAPDDVFAQAMDRMARLLDADRSMLFVLDPERGHLIPTAARGFRRDDLGGTSIPGGEGLVGRSFLEGRALTYSRPADVTPSDPFILRFPVRDGVAVPVRAEGQLVGVLYAGRRGREAPFTTDEILLLQVIADRIATAFAHQRLVDRAAGHLGRLREIQVFSGQALVGRDLTETLVRACEVGCRLLDVRIAALGIPDERGQLGLAASSGMPARMVQAWRADARSGLALEMFSARRPLSWRDLEERAEVEERFLRELEVRACLVVPLRIHDKIVGVLYLADPNPRDFAPEEMEAAQVLASLAALAIENERLYGEVRESFQALTAAQERLIQTEKARALGGMAGGVAHEFNNILAIILGKTQLLQARGLEEPAREGLGQIEEAAWRAADVVRRLQGFAATRSDEPPALLELNSLVHDAVTLTRGLWKDEAEARGVRIEVITDLEETAPVLGNAAELREAVTNLILNSIDAMPRGGRLALTTRRRGDGVEVTVSDSGEGMSEEVRRRIFEPFFSTRTPVRSGLGLAVVHGIVTRHRGRIDVFSEEGRGATVTVWLPASSVAPAPESARGEGAEAPGAPAVAWEPGTPASILVLEDEEQIRGMLVDALSEAGHKVEAAADGLSGLARFQRGSFDVVLTDLSLPERSGLEVASAVKRMRPGTPVVLITGWGHLLDPARLREHGVDLTLVKPFRLDRVLSVLSDALRLRGAS